MSQNPLVLALHFLLEVAAVVAVGYWAWASNEGAWRWVLVIGLPVLAVAAWAVFRAAGDGPTPMVAIPGLARLALELAILGGAALLLALADRPILAAAFAALIVLDYALSYDRVARLIGS